MWYYQTAVGKRFLYFSTQMAYRLKDITDEDITALKDVPKSGKSINYNQQEDPNGLNPEIVNVS